MNLNGTSLLARFKDSTFANAAEKTLNLLISVKRKLPALTVTVTNCFMKTRKKLSTLASFLVDIAVRRRIVEKPGQVHLHLPTNGKNARLAIPKLSRII